VILIGALLTLTGLGSIGFVAASVLEEHDSFCVSCHTAPEVTYFNRAYLALDYPDEPVYDLSTAHYVRAQRRDISFRCIDCHRGDASVGHRVATVALGAKDVLIWLTGRDDPTIEKAASSAAWLPDAACTACHTDTLLLVRGLDNHFHTSLPQAADARRNGGKLTVSPAFTGDAQAFLESAQVDIPLLCTDCHVAHKTVQPAVRFFLDRDPQDQACLRCHVKAGRGPRTIQELGR
jgi:predicted CXXCH cytochrome family protein